MADLTRFDFNAYNFLNSETVEIMTDAEIGQYIMLLAKSWTLGKGASLPDDPELLAKWAHCKRVSDRVLFKFPLADTEFGPRRRNSVLFAEWLRTLERHETAVEIGRKGGMSTSIYKIDAARENGKMGGRPRNPSETQAETEAQSNPIHTKPNQSNPSSFKNLAVRYRTSFGVNLSHGSATKDSYAAACREYSEDVVLACFDEWAPENMWIKDRRHTNGLRQFYDALPAMVESEQAVRKQKEAETQKEEDRESAQVRSIEAGHREFLENEKILLQELEEQDAAAKRIADNPRALFGSTE